MATIIEIGGKEYRLDRLTAFQQLHVSRKIAPLVPKIFPLMGLAASLTGADKGEILARLMASGDGFAAALGPLAEVLATMPDDHVNFVLSECLSIVFRRNGDRWASVWNAKQGVSMFDDIDMAVMLRLAFEVIRESLGNFISGLLSGLGDVATTSANG